MKRRDLKPIILEESLRLFDERGYDNVTIMDICEACDITKPTFYRYAAGKSDLLQALFESIPSAFDDVWKDVTVQGNWYECIRLGFCRYLAHFLDYGLPMCRQLYIQNVYTPKDSFQIDASFETDMCVVITNAQRAGDIQSKVPALDLLRVILSVMIGYVCNWIIHDGETDIMAGFTASLHTICEATV